MSDLINRNDIYKLFENGIAKLHVSDIDVIPTVDAVEVVRCKDCARREVCRTSTVWAVPPNDNWFCADGERKEVADEET